MIRLGRRFILLLAWSFRAWLGRHAHRLLQWCLLSGSARTAAVAFLGIPAVRRRAPISKDEQNTKRLGAVNHKDVTDVNEPLLAYVRHPQSVKRFLHGVDRYWSEWHSGANVPSPSRLVVLSTPAVSSMLAVAYSSSSVRLPLASPVKRVDRGLE
jgi:hypothetical protein